MRQLTSIVYSFAPLLIGGLLVSSEGRAQTLDPETQAKILKGLAIAPVPLNMVGKDPSLVGLGSLIVNASADCNGCHTADPSVQYSNGGNPYFNQHPAVVNPATYLGGGNDFGAFPDPNGPFPHIISRNLTPDASGLPEGGNTYDQFVQIMRTGVDMDHVHPTCAGPPNTKCLPAPFDGDLLQIMPWPTFSSMTDHDLLAIYTYLSAIPCLEGGPGEPPNRCGTATPKPSAVALPKNSTVMTRQINLDGTQSRSSDGKPLTYLCTIPQGSPQAGIIGNTTTTPTIQFWSGRGMYMFQLTVTDSTGHTASDFAAVSFVGN